MVPKTWDTSLWEGVWPYVDPWDNVRLRTAATHWNVPGKYGPHGELFFFFLQKKEPMVLSELIEFGPCISAETLKACALICLHMMVEENAQRETLPTRTCPSNLQGEARVVICVLILRTAT